MGVPHLCEVVAAPEQDVEVSGDKRTDVYLLSALLFWLATDFHPLISTTGEQKMKRQDGELQLLTTPSQIGLEHQVPASLEKLIMRGLSVDPKDRFADASQMREYLLSGHEPARAPTEPPPPTPPESMEEKTERKKIIDAINNRVEALQQSEREFATTTDDFSAQEVSRANKRKSRAKLLFVAFLTGAAIVAAILFVFFYGLGGRAWDEIEVASGCVIKFYKVKEQTAKRVGKVLEGTGYWKRRPNSPVAISWEEGRYVLSFRVPQKVVKDVEVQRWHCRFGHVLSLNVFEGCDVGIRLGLSPLEDKGVIRLTARGTERHTYEGNALLCVRPVSKELALAFAQVLKSRGIFTSDSKSAVYLEHEGGKIYLELRLLGDARGSKKVVSSLQQTANLLSLRAAKGKSVVIRMYDETGDNPLLIESSQS
mgnify:CR=1 FL=1